MEELATHSNELTFLSADDKPEEVKFSILPQDLRDFVTKDVQVLNSERIIGYNTYNNILEKSKHLNSENADYYNVTVNFIMKRNTAGGKAANAHRELPIQVYEKSVAEVVSQKQKRADDAQDEDNEPKVIMPAEIAKNKLSEQKQAQAEDAQDEQTQELVEVASQGMVKTVEKHVEGLPIELTNEQIAAQLDSLTPDEAIQLAEEAQVATKPSDTTNLQLNDDVQTNKSSNNTEGKSIAELALEREAQTIEQSFTEYAQKSGEKTAMDKLFDQDFNKLDKQQMEQLKNVTQQISQEMTKRDKEHFEFLNRVH